MNFNDFLIVFNGFLWKFMNFGQIMIWGYGSAWFFTLNSNPASKPAQTRLKTRFLSKIRFLLKIRFFIKNRGRRTGRSLLNPPDHLGGKGVLKIGYNLPSRKILDSKKSLRLGPGADHRARLSARFHRPKKWFSLVFSIKRGSKIEN